MILSKEHNFLLLKNHKVGGTSLEVPLSMVLPKTAIVTPKTANHPAWKIKNEPSYDGYLPRNYDGFYNHISYSEIKNKIDISNVNAYVFVRHPFNAVLSHFFHRLYFLDNLNEKWESCTKEEKKQLVDMYFNNQLGWEWYKSSKSIYLSSENKIQVKEILKYENGVEEEINKILPKHNIQKIKLNIFEKSFRPKNIKYNDVFEEHHLDLIAKEWNWEFENLGYK
jgi:hypothetical protein